MGFCAEVTSVSCVELFAEVEGSIAEVVLRALVGVRECDIDTDLFFVVAVGVFEAEAMKSDTEGAG